MSEPKDLVFDEVGADDVAALRAWHDLDRAAHAVDRPEDPAPCWVEHRARLTAPWPGVAERAWLARSGDAVVGVAALALPMLDNRGTGHVELVVAPGHRRRGFGRRLLAHLDRRARAEGRVRLLGETVSPLGGPGGATRFAAAVGAHEALSDVRRRLTLPVAPLPLDGAVLERLAEEARQAATGYELLQWDDSTPARWRDDMARLAARMSTDAPLGDLSWEAENHDAQRVAARDAMCRAHGYRQTVTAARGPDGRLVGFTELTVRASLPGEAAQWDTIVDPAHRGHRLGLALKIANLRRLREKHPEVRTIDTLNAASNRHMIAINAAMGFVPVNNLGEWQLELGF